MPTTNGLLIFYRSTASGTEAVVGRIDPQSGKAPIDGLERWSHIVSVRSVLPTPG